MLLILLLLLLLQLAALSRLLGFFSTAAAAHVSPQPNSSRPPPPDAEPDAGVDGDAEADADSAAGLGPESGSEAESGSASSVAQWRQRLRWGLAGVGTVALLAACGWSQGQTAGGHVGGEKGWPGVGLGIAQGSAVAVLIYDWRPSGYPTVGFEQAAADEYVERLFGKASWWGNLRCLASDESGSGRDIYYLLVPLVALIPLLWAWPVWVWWRGRRWRAVSEAEPEANTLS